MSENLAKLKELSSKIGKDPLLVQGAGGNTSLKENGLLWVKASGKKLRNALEEDIFVAFDLEIMKRQIIENPNKENLKFENLFGSHLRPSIETVLHAQIPSPVVLHTHSVDVIACSLISNAKEEIDKSLGDINWKWIPYRRPGWPLAEEIRKALDNDPLKVLILANHGLVVAAENSDQAETLQKEVVSRLKQIPRKYIPPDIPQLSKIIKQIPKARLPKYEVIHSLATDEWNFNLSKRNSPYPDHIVFCGQHPWIVDEINTHKKNTIYGIVPGKGVILLNQASLATEEMLKAQADIFLRLPVNNPVNFLTDKDCDELINWEAEKYRKNLNLTDS